MDVRFDGKRALVTGAGKGIGRGIAKLLLECGAETFALSRTQSDLDSLKEEHPGIHTVCVDLASWNATRKAVEDIGPIDLLVNNAAVSPTPPFLKVTEEEIDKTFNVNLKAIFNVSQVIAKGMVERGQGGSIVNISSLFSTIAYSAASVYCTTKGGLDHLTRVMALELGPHQIRVNTVNRGVVLTKLLIEMTTTGKMPSSYIEDMKKRSPQKKLTEVHDVARAVVYLLSDKADMINGAKLMVDGGITIC